MMTNDFFSSFARQKYVMKISPSLLVYMYRRIMPLAKILSSKFQICPGSSVLGQLVMFWTVFFSLRHYPLICKPPEGVYVLNKLMVVNQSDYSQISES